MKYLLFLNGELLCTYDDLDRLVDSYTDYIDNALCIYKDLYLSSSSGRSLHRYVDFHFTIYLVEHEHSLSRKLIADFTNSYHFSNCL